MHLEAGRYRSIFSVDRGYIRHETVRHGTFTNDRVARILSRISFPLLPHLRAALTRCAHAYVCMYVYMCHACTCNVHGKRAYSLQVPCTSTGVYLSVRNHRRRRTIYLLIVVALTIVSLSLPPFLFPLYRKTMDRPAIQ